MLVYRVFNKNQIVFEVIWGVSDLLRLRERGDKYRLTLYVRYPENSADLFLTVRATPRSNWANGSTEPDAALE